MTEVAVWMAILAAASVGFGLGWWWFFVPSLAAGSATQARRRAMPDARGTGHGVAPAEQDALHTRHTDSRTELATLRAAMEQARSDQAAAEHALASDRSRLASVHASLEEARAECDALRAELDQAQRRFRRRTGSAPLPDPTRPAVRVASKPANGSAPTGPAPDSLADLSQLPQPSLTLPAPPPRRPRSPVDVLFGPLGGVPLTTSARSIPWELTVRLRASPDAPTQLSDVAVTLRFDLEDEGLSINSRRRGPLSVCRGASITSTRPLHIQVSLSTGVHSDTPEADRPPALPGKHRVIIAVEYRRKSSQDTSTTVRFSAHIPVISASI